jgi:hypothetical protein
VAFLVQDLRSEILWGAAERKSLSIVLKDFGKAKVGKANVTIFVHKNILRLQVSVYDMFLM